MTILAVTGQIGAGKSTVCRMLMTCGAVHVDADQVAREILDPGMPAYGLLVQQFGNRILDPAGAIDRKMLARIVFSEESAMAQLNRITHPKVAERILSRLSDLRDAGAEVVAVEAALLSEVKVTFWDHVIVVTASPETRLGRLLRAGMDPEDARRRMEIQAQMSWSALAGAHVIDNGEDLALTRQHVMMLWQALRLPGPA